ncbi:MAG TPA: fatty acid--CoA ligase [Caulobacteraceae bacterium]|nr:fatty acid--CoA ligase [Caulobacteraceae bacterium]
MATDTTDARSLGDIARIQARARGGRTAFVFEDRATTYAEFDRRTNQVANGLAALGVRPGDRVAYLGKNSDAYFELLFGAAKAGAVMAPINWRLAPPEIRYIVGDAGAKALFVGPEFIDQARGLLPDFTSVLAVIAAEGGAADWPDYAAWRDTQSDADPGVAVGWEDAAIQLYTSGTTGHPKGAVLPHRALLGPRALQKAADTPWNRWSEDDVSLVAMPVFHIGGSGWGIMGLYNGAKGVIAREFDPNRVLDFIAEDRITKMFMVPAAMQIVVRHPKAREVDFSCLKYLLYGASPIPLDLLKECMEVFGCGFVQMYGMTETSGTIVALPPEDHDPAGNRRMRSAGKALPGVELAILDEAGARLAPGEVGEIATRSMANMSGYWNLPDATALTIDADGWLRTGDAGYMDEDGYVYIHDRVKDMIITGGENVYPAEVENAIFGHPAVADVAVIGVPDAKWGEAVKAVVVRKAGAEPTPAEIIAWARERIAGYKTPKSVDFIDALPRNASGKILRRELREPYWAGLERRVS